MDLELLLFFVIALVPGLFWLFALALRTRTDPEFRRLVFKTFFLGMAICFPAGFFNSWLIVAFGGDDGGWVSQLLMFVLVVGPNEEGLKFLIVWSEVYRQWRFRSASDGIVFATASAIGFATYENATYMQTFGIQVLLIRAWACVLAHLCFSAIFGYYLGLAKSRRYNPVPCIVEGLALAALFHGLYDFFVGMHDLALYGLVGFLVAYYVLLQKGNLRPYLSMIAPEWMARVPEQEGSLRFQRRRLPVQKQPAVNRLVIQALQDMEADDDAARIRGLQAAAGILDQRLMERVQELTHDPVEAVRGEADRVHRDLRRKSRG